MSSARALANHQLYLARILLRGWGAALSDEDDAASAVNQAFQVPVCEYLVAAYGWFLLEIARPDALPAHPPRHCSALPATAPGKVLPAEIREFQELERSSWLGELLASCTPEAPIPGRPESLATPVAAAPDMERVATWADHLAAMFERMSDSLEEY